MLEMFPIAMSINLDDTVYLCIEPFDQERIACLGMCERYNTSFTLICSAFPQIFAMDISELYEYFYDCIDGFMYSSLYMEECFSPQVFDTSGGLEYLRMNDIVPRT